MLHFTSANPRARKESKPRPLGSNEAEITRSFISAVGFGELTFVKTLDPYFNFTEDEMKEADFTSWRRKKCLVWVSAPASLRMDSRGLKNGDMIVLDGEDSPMDRWRRVTYHYYNGVTLSDSILGEEGQKISFTVFRPENLR